LNFLKCPYAVWQFVPGVFQQRKIRRLCLLGCTLVSLVIANSGWGESYVHFWHKHFNLSFANIHLDYSIEHWINDGLMAVFFLLVGLEIERELYAGELSDIRNASLPMAAAVGGMLVPAACSFMHEPMARLHKTALAFPWLPTLPLRWACWRCWAIAFRCR
jgi:Na+/H+ antiporter NhaA